MELCFSENVIAHDSPLGFIWGPRIPTDSFGKLEMVRRNEVETSIIDIAGRGLSTEMIYKKLGLKFSNDQLAGAIDSLLKSGILVNKTKNLNLQITGSRKKYYPLHLCVELTTRCNLNCKHCYKNGSDTSTAECDISEEKLITVISELAEHGLQVVELTGGECTLHKRMISIVDSILRIKNIRLIALITNGVLLNNDILDHFEDKTAKIVFSISLDSYDASTQYT